MPCTYRHLLCILDIDPEYPFGASFHVGLVLDLKSLARVLRPASRSALAFAPSTQRHGHRNLQHPATTWQTQGETVMSPTIRPVVFTICQCRVWQMPMGCQCLCSHPKCRHLGPSLHPKMLDSVAGQLRILPPRFVETRNPRGLGPNRHRLGSSV